MKADLTVKRRKYWGVLFEELSSYAFACGYIQQARIEKNVSGVVCMDMSVTLTGESGHYKVSYYSHGKYHHGRFTKLGEARKAFKKAIKEVSIWLNSLDTDEV